MSIHYSLSHRIKNLSSNLSFLAKTLWTNPDDPALPRIIRHFMPKPLCVTPDDPDQRRIIRTQCFPNDPDLARIIRPLPPKRLWTTPDDPALPRIIRPWQLHYIQGRRRGCPNSSLSFPAASFFLLKTSCDDLEIRPGFLWSFKFL